MACFDNQLVLLALLRRRRAKKKLLRLPKRSHRWWIRPTLRERKNLSQANGLIPLMKTQDREWYFKYMRMSPERFNHLLALTQDKLLKTCWNREPIRPEVRLAITLRYLATGDSQMSLAFDFVVAPQTIGKILRETCEAIADALSTYIETPTTTSDWEKVAEGFFAEWNFPHVMGALDGKHINIQCPKNCGSDFYNYKNFHSINLMALCDAAYSFLFVDIGSYGRDNDAAVFGRTALFEGFEKNLLNRPDDAKRDGFTLPYIILADEIFPLKPWLLKPYPGRQLTESQTIFNYRLSRARRTIENAFGILSAKWRVFRRPIIANLDLVDLIVKSTTSLHNYLLSTDNARYLPTGFVDSFNDAGELIEGNWRQDSDSYGLRNLAMQGSRNPTQCAKTVRNNYCEYVNSNAGAVPWQVSYVRNCGHRNE